MNMPCFCKTPSGAAAFKERSTLISQRQRAVFVLCDGKRSVDAVLQAAAAVSATSADIDYLVAQGFLCAVVETAPAPVPPLAPEPVSAVVAAGPDAAQQRSIFRENWTMF